MLKAVEGRDMMKVKTAAGASALPSLGLFARDNDFVFFIFTFFNLLNDDSAGEKTKRQQSEGDRILSRRRLKMKRDSHVDVTSLFSLRLLFMKSLASI